MDIFRRKKFDEAMFAKNRTLAIRVGRYQSSDIKEASFDYGYIKGDTYKPGGTCAGSGKITFTSIITTFNKLDKVYPEIGLLVDGTYEWVKMGEYFINDIKIDRNRNTTKLDLMDGMFKLNREHVTELTYPAEIRQVIKEICLKTGVKLANENMDIASMNYVIEKIPKEKKMTFRDVLSLATQMLGMSCFFNREGKLEIKELTESSITITADSYFMHGLTKSEVEYQIAGITCKKDKEALTVGMRTGRSLELDNLFMSQVVLDDLYHRIKDIRYYPFNLNYQGHLLLNVGEWVTIKTNTGEIFKSPVLNQSFTFKGGLRGRISADSKAGNDAQYSYAGTLTKKIEQFSEFEKQIQNQIEEADKGFNQKVAKIKKDFSDQVELAKAKTEEVKRQLSDTIDQRFSSFNNGPLQEVKRRAEEALRNAGASTLLAQEAKRIGLDSIAKLEAFKSQATSAQTALSGDLDALKRTVTSEVNQASEYRRTTTEALSRMTGQMNGFATKSEVRQDVAGLTETFAKMKVGGRNLLRGSKGPFLPDRKPADFDNAILYVGNTSIYMEQGQEYTISAKTDGNFTALHENKESDNVVLWIMDKDVRNYQIVSDLKTGATGTKIIWNKPTGIYHLRVNTYHKEAVKSVWDVKIEKGNVATDWSPAIEDTDGLITEAKATFERTAQGLRTDLSAIQEYVNKDGQRQEALQRYAREESARQVSAVRELVTRDYVGKSTYQEDARGLERKFEAITNPQNGTIATQIAKYKNAVDGRFADITSLIVGKASQADFQRVQETSKLYERIIGRSESDIADKVARMALTNQLFQVEVGKYANAGGPNMLRNSRADDGLKYWSEANGRLGFTAHPFYFNGQKRMFELRQGAIVKSPRFIVKRNTNYTLNILVFDNNSKYFKIYFCKRKKGVTSDFEEKQLVFDGRPSLVDGPVFNNSKSIKKSFKFNVGDYDDGYLQFEYDRNNPNKWGGLFMTELDFYEGDNDRKWQPSPEDATLDTDKTLEATQTKLTLLQGSFAFQNLTSPGAIVSQINATNNQILIEAEKIRLKGKTLLDELTAIDGYFKRLFVGEGNFAKLNAEIIGSRTITADKLIMDQAMARMFVSSDIFTDTLAAKEAFINKLRSVVVSATLLEGFKGRIGGFQIGTHDKDPNTYWLTGQNQFYVGMSNGAGNWGKTALWVNWGTTWDAPGNYAWFVKESGEMFCYNRAYFWNTPVINGDLRVTGDIYYNNKNSGKSGYWIYSPQYKQIFSENGYMYFVWGGGGSDWIPLNKEISDRRYKSNIEASAVSGLDVIENLKTYSYRKEYNGKIEDIACGIMAQDVQKHAPEAFFENPDGAYSYNTFALVPYLIKAIQELNQKIEKLEKTA